MIGLLELDVQQKCKIKILLCDDTLQERTVITLCESTLYGNIQY